MPLLVLLLTAAFGAFASVVVASLGEGQSVASYRDVGADYRLERAALGSLPTFDPMAIPGVQAAASGVVDASAVLETRQLQRAAFRFEAVDVRAYGQVTAGTPVEPAWPSAMLDAPPTDAGTAQHPIPVIMSWQVPQGTADLHIGDTFQISVDGYPRTFRVVDRWDRFAGSGDQPEFGLAPYDWLKVAIGKQAPLPTVMWLKGGPGVAKPLAAAVAGGSVNILSRHDVLDGLQDDPLGNALVIAFAAALGVAGVYLALTVIGALILSAARRTQDLAYLRVLGVSAPQTLGLTIVENAPPVLVAMIPGVALGIGIAFLVEPGLGLATFVGASGVTLFVDWGLLALMVVALVAVFVLAVAAGTWLARRARLVNALRMGEE
jgi:putative ABC transport system permease protein